jgi:hypothetical protein
MFSVQGENNNNFVVKAILASLRTKIKSYIYYIYLLQCVQNTIDFIII